ncbi:MAG: DUF1987 domain-containing protein [Bacteroidales bacterium]|nr:DUF1987 domain-containing protein [Bacteroidales bacterium]
MKLKSIHIDGHHGTYYIPTIDLDVETGICEISGESYLEDTASFYAPVVDWLDKYCSKIKKPLNFNFNLEYYNTSSSKCIVDIMSLLKKHSDMGLEITVNWHYDADNEDFEEEVEEVEDFMLETGLKINLIPK